jgi:hypothetical protein
MCIKTRIITAPFLLGSLRRSTLISATPPDANLRLALAANTRRIRNFGRDFPIKAPLLRFALCLAGRGRQRSSVLVLNHDLNGTDFVGQQDGTQVPVTNGNAYELTPKPIANWRASLAVRHCSRFGFPWLGWVYAGDVFDLHWGRLHVGRFPDDLMAAHYLERPSSGPGIVGASCALLPSETRLLEPCPLC